MAEKKKKYRLVTRSDMDGLVCAVLLKELDLISDIKFVHPKDVQDNKIDISQDDITTNLPYVEHAYLVFDHHASEIIRVGKNKSNHIINPDAPSAARVVYEHFGGNNTFPNIPKEMLLAVDKADSAQFTTEDVLNPRGWELLSFLMDARTGLGRFVEFRVSNYTLMINLIDYCRDHSIDAILDLPDVKERVDMFFSHQQAFKEQIRRCSTVYGNLVVLDLRREDVIYAGNRFMIYALYPECNISIHVMWGLKKQNTVFAVGKSIFNRTSETDIGTLMLRYGGGGHPSAGTCQVPHEVAESILKEIIDTITENH